jgi:hypothetical protein
MELNHFEKFIHSMEVHNFFKKSCTKISAKEKIIFFVIMINITEENK